jgi:hypothetical protein
MITYYKIDFIKFRARNEMESSPLKEEIITGQIVTKQSKSTESKTTKKLKNNQYSRK